MQQISSPTLVSAELVKTDGWVLLQHCYSRSVGLGQDARIPRTSEFPGEAGAGQSSAVQLLAAKTERLSSPVPLPSVAFTADTPLMRLF